MTQEEKKILAFVKKLIQLTEQDAIEWDQLLNMYSCNYNTFDISVEFPQDSRPYITINGEQIEGYEFSWREHVSFSLRIKYSYMRA